MGREPLKGDTRRPPVEIMGSDTSNGTSLEFVPEVARILREVARISAEVAQISLEGARISADFVGSLGTATLGTPICVLVAQMCKRS